MVLNLFHCTHVCMLLDGFFVQFKFALQFFFITVFHIFQAVAEKETSVLFNVVVAGMLVLDYTWPNCSTSYLSVIDSEPKRLRSIFLAFVILILKDPTDLHQGMVLEYTKKHAIGECAFNPRTQIWCGHSDPFSSMRQQKYACWTQPQISAQTTSLLFEAESHSSSRSKIKASVVLKWFATLLYLST